MHVIIALHHLTNTDGTITVRGKKQIVLEWGPSRFQLLLTMNLYDAGGRHVARLRRNEWTFNDHDRFAFVSEQRRFRVTDTQSGRVALRGRVEGQDSVVISDGTFYSAAGEEVEILVEGWSNVLKAPAPTLPTTQSTQLPDEIASIPE